MNKNILAAILGSAFLIIILYLAFTTPCESSVQFLVLKSVLAVSAAALSAIIPGFLNITYNRTIRAGGALGVLVLFYFYTPALVGATDYCGDFDFTVKLQ